ncbi:FGGY-family carbohydrate kinase [Buttiauxella gaviniae]|uniref:FGGY-family carbohydrate kinase n=1 Tax=Enterobacterales TaxID=91347 RepID=UPI0039AFF52C
MNYYLGLDSGGTFIKAALFNAKGDEIAIYRKSANVLNEQQGWVERNLEGLWQDACDVIKGVLEKAKIDPSMVKGVSISAQGKGLYLLDKDGNDLRNGILSSDSRSIDIVKRWQKDHIPDQIYPLTLQTLWTGHPVSILRWIKEHEPAHYHNVGSIMMSHDYLRYRLTGVIAAEITNMSESNFFNAQTGNYDIELLKTFGVEEAFSALPPLIYPTDQAGYINNEAARNSGLMEGTPVYGGLFDVVSTAICSGIDSTEQKLNAVMGTWGVTSGITRDLVLSDTYKYVYGHHAIANEYIIHEASPTSASNYEWFAPYFGNNGEIDHIENEQLVSELPALSTDIIFVPFLYGSNAGLGLKSGLYGLQAHHTKGHLIQGIWEGVLFCHNLHLQRMLKRFPDAKILRVTGGTTKSNTWMQMLSDLTGMPLEIQDIEETGALGAALVCMVGAGEYPSLKEAVKEIKVDIKTLQPNLSNHANYQIKYQRYLKFIDVLKTYEDL